MKNLPNNSVDLIIIDPPYNLNKNFGNNSDRWEKVEDWFNWSKKWINESNRVLKRDGSIFVYGIHNYIGYLQCYLYEIGLKYGRMFIWFYENGWSGYIKKPSANYEPILWFTKSDKYTYIPIREPYKSIDRIKYKITKNGKSWNPNPLGKHGGDIWQIPTLAGKSFEKEKVDHPTQKPLELCDKIINHFSKKNDLVLIPFAGSGSELVSAKKNNRNYIGFELNDDYIKIAKKRLKSIK
ncbi:MAG: site-specific DNA-methyltransferase [Patescibacteria group bacterium]